MQTAAPSTTALGTSAPSAAPTQAPAPQTFSDGTPVDLGVLNLTKAIRQTESGGNYAARGASGEFGAYQWMPGNFQADAAAAGIKNPNPNDPATQNKVAYFKLLSLKQQGLSPQQIASVWNAGIGEPDAYTGKFSNGKPSVGLNPKGIHMDVPGYVSKVISAAQQYAKGTIPTAGGTASTAIGVGDQESKPGFVQSMIQGAANPFLQLARFPLGLLQEGVGKLFGSQPDVQRGAELASNMPADFGFLGKVNAAGYDANGKSLDLGNATAQAVGAGLQIAPWLIGAGEAGSAAEKIGQTSFGALVKGGAKTGAAIGGLSGIGTSLQSQGEEANGIDPGKVLTSGAVGAGAGALTGGMIGGASSVLPLVGVGAKTGSEVSDQAMSDLQKGVADKYGTALGTGTGKGSIAYKYDTDPLMTAARELNGLSNEDGKYVATPDVEALEGKMKSVAQATRPLLESTGKDVNLTDIEKSSIADAKASVKGSAQDTAVAKIKGEFSAYRSQYANVGYTDSEGNFKIPVQHANDIKMDLYDKGYTNPLADPETQTKAGASRIMGRATKDAINKATEGAGGAQLKGLNDHYGELSDLKNFLQSKDGVKLKGGTLGKLSKFIPPIMKEFTPQGVIDALRNPNIPTWYSRQLLQKLGSDAPTVEDAAQQAIQSNMEKRGATLALPEGGTNPVGSAGNPIIAKEAKPLTPPNLDRKAPVINYSEGNVAPKTVFGKAQEMTPEARVSAQKEVIQAAMRYRSKAGYLNAVKNNPALADKISASGITPEKAWNFALGEFQKMGAANPLARGKASFPIPQTNFGRP